MDAFHTLTPSVDDGGMTRFPLPPPEPPASVHWASPEFLAEMRAFVEGAVGPVELEQSKLRGWSTVLTARNDHGLFWAKQNCSLQAFEAALLDELGAVVPDRVVPLTAVDRDRGLLLMPDMGAVFALLHDDLGVWCDVARQWAQLQREVLPYVDRLAAAGVGTLLPTDAEEMLAERVPALNALPVDDPRRLADDEAAAITGAADRVREAVEVVAGLGLPTTLDHNDLHGGNVFGIVQHVLGCEPDDPRLWQVAEAWIEVWDDVAPATALRAALPHAMRLARLVRHEGWLRVTPPMTADELAEWGSAAAEHLAAVPRRPLLASAD
jgi:hypothetical protein